MDKLTTRRKIMKIALTIIVIILGTYLVGYFSSRNSDAFGVAQRFIRESPIVQTKLGKVADLQLTPFGYELEFSGSSGSADFECNVKGAVGSGKAHIKLKKYFGEWKVTEARLFAAGQEVSLMP
ncbi:MAG: cytochrome c oxidase assembly factor Coa1 family protein [Thiobacillus sp.]|nr:cytochrome c oxidase assembly factor Coa1 family protein [Thiobacillus sp.]